MIKPRAKYTSTHEKISRTKLSTFSARSKHNSNNIRFLTSKCAVTTFGGIKWLMFKKLHSIWLISISTVLIKKIKSCAFAVTFIFKQVPGNVEVSTPDLNRARRYFKLLLETLFIDLVTDSQEGSAWYNLQLGFDKLWRPRLKALLKCHTNWIVGWYPSEMQLLSLEPQWLVPQGISDQPWNELSTFHIENYTSLNKNVTYYILNYFFTHSYLEI